MPRQIGKEELGTVKTFVIELQMLDVNTLDC